METAELRYVHDWGKKETEYIKFPFVMVFCSNKHIYYEDILKIYKYYLKEVA